MKRILFPFLLSLFIFSSCSKKDAINYSSNTKGALTVEFDNIVGSSDLQLNTATYKNVVGETFKVTKLRYYVSNFIVTKTDGTVFTVPQDSCYFLMDESDGTQHLAALRVPEGEYKTLAFTVGVDSLRSTMDVSQRTGSLDPAGANGDMYWGWNSGYIFFKMEGTSPVSPTGKFMYHIGFYGGFKTHTLNNIRNVSLDLSRGIPQVKAGKKTNIHLMVDILNVFNGSTQVSIAKNSEAMFEDLTSTIANNYMGMFWHDHTEN